jgi:tripartite-type tricarboxylate transporter receptor subunit TctC
VLDRLNGALRTAIQEASFKDSMAKLGATAVPLDKATPEALRTHLKAEIDRWTPIIRKAGVYAD